LGKVTCTHQTLALLISAGETALIHTLERRSQNDVGKIKQAERIAASPPTADVPTYALMDSWYTCQAAAAFRRLGRHVIGALKNNRCLNH
jgi:hypothetical protein